MGETGFCTSGRPTVHPPGLCQRAGQEAVKGAIEDYGLPEPDHVIGDVGTTLYHVVGGRWHMSDTWQKTIEGDWNGYRHADIIELLEKKALPAAGMELQPPEQQGRYKISYFPGASVDHRRVVETLSNRLAEFDISANLIWSLDDAAGRGLLDILPRSANKLHAIRYLMKTQDVNDEEAVFAGDSGNDLDVLTSGMQAILVNNASEAVRQKALEQLARSGKPNQLYLATGGAFNMNGNYAAGVIEGVAHFFPDTSAWIQTAIEASADPEKQQ
jgi:hypothetical protein